MGAELPSRILYLEDNPRDADLVRRVLARQAPHIALDIASDLATGMQRLIPEPPDYDLILTELNLPDGNGAELLMHVRERHLPIALVILTGSGDQEAAIAALKAGADDYVVKRDGYCQSMLPTLSAALVRFRSEFERKTRLLHEQAKQRTTAERLSRLLEANPTILYALRTDDNCSTLSWISENVTRVYGYTVEECLQPGWWRAALHVDDRERVLSDHRRLFDEQALSIEYRFYDKAGGVRWVRDDMRLLHDSSGKPTEVAGSWSDITATHQANERQQLHAAALNSTRDGVMITDLDARILSVNPAFTEISGYTESEVAGRNPSLLQSGRHDRAFFQAMWKSLQEQGQWQGEIWNRRKNGDICLQWMTINAVRDEQGKPSHYVAAITDLTLIMRSQEQLEHLAHYDPLTDLPNRVLLRSLLQHALEKAQRHGHHVGVLFLNLDKFKTINDSLGHALGDQLLLNVTERLDHCVGGAHMLGRLSADEFVIVVESLQEPSEAEIVALNLLQVLDTPFVLGDGHEVYVRASIGISLYPQDGSTAHELLYHAGAAMHKAKERGGSQVAFYTSELSAHALAQLKLEAGLRRALKQGEFVLYFQPKVDLVTGRVTGAEALLRWLRPGYGIVLPSEFIPFAERNGQIVGIGAWTIDETCRQIRAWSDSGLTDINVAVNVSARQFRSEELEAVITDALARHGVQARQLTLELTESMLMEDPEKTIKRLRSMKDIDLKLSLDDFGTGYSSLAYLSRLPMDQLKIDRSFVSGIGSDLKAANIADSVIDLAHRMQLLVVAEGVENEAQLCYLSRNRCDEMQGYYFSEPVPTDRFAKLLHEGKSLSVRSAQ